MGCAEPQGNQRANLSIRVKTHFGRPTVHRDARFYVATVLTGYSRGVRSTTVEGPKMLNTVLHLPGCPEGAYAATVLRPEIHPLSTTLNHYTDGTNPDEITSINSVSEFFRASNQEGSTRVWEFRASEKYLGRPKYLELQFLPFLRLEYVFASICAKRHSLDLTTSRWDQSTQ